MKRTSAIALLAAALMLPAGAATGSTTTASAPDVVRSPDGQAVANGTNGAKVTKVSSSSHSASVLMTVPPLTKQQASGRMSPAQQAAAAGPTVFEQMKASGMSDKEACDFATGVDDRGCQTNVSYARKVASRATAARATASVYTSSCSNLSSYVGDGHKTAHACVVRYKDWVSGANWYVANKMKMSANTVNPGWAHDRMNDLRVQDRWGSGNKTVDWAPFATRNVGSCSDKTTSVSSPKTGASYSSTATVCPDKISPYSAYSYRWFGSRWTGLAHGEDYVGTTAATVVHSPATARPSFNLYAYMHWN